MRLLLHFGAHKTGSTSLQSLLTRNTKALSDMGVRQIPAKDFLASTAYDTLKQVRRHNTVSDEHLAAVADWIRPYAEGPSTALLLSFEGLYGQHNLAKMGGFYPQHDAVNVLMAATRRHCDVQVMMFFRAQDTYLESTYLQTAHYGSTQSFYDYISSFDLTTLRWSPVIESLHERFGAENVTVHPFEHIRAGFPAFVERLLRPLFGAETEQRVSELTFSDADSRNRSFSEVALRIAQASYPLISEHEDAMALRAFLQSKFSNVTHPRAKLMAPHFRTFFMSAFREDNLRALELAGETDPSVISRYVL